jgi:hypothetical protein
VRLPLEILSPLPPASLARATERLRSLVELADTVPPTDEVRRRAARLVAVHPLRAADALQLAAALLWCEEQPHNEGFVCLDDRLRDAARNEGFDVRPEAPATSFYGVRKPTPEVISRDSSTAARFVWTGSVVKSAVSAGE